MINKIILVIIILAIVVGGIVLVVTGGNKQTGQQGSTSQTQENIQGTTPVPEKNEVMIANNAFSPDILTVKAGDKVTWTNQDLAGHTATADDNSFDTNTIVPGQSKSVTLNNAGTYTYHSTTDPDMKATIVVE